MENQPQASTPEHGAVDKAAVARFDPKLKLYNLISVTWVLIISVIGIPLIPIWLLGWGQWLSRRQYEALQCEVTERSLHYRHGVLFKTEKTIPLEQIQDLTVKEGPIQRALGLCALRIETAGQSQPQGASDATLTGIVEPARFRDLVLSLRDRSREAPVGSPPGESAAIGELLTDIRDSLRRIEQNTQR